MTENKSSEAFRTISEVAELLNVPQHVLRFWETKFSAVRPMKRAGNRRYYRPEDLDLLKVINKLLYVDGYTIRGVQKLLKDNGNRQVVQAHIDDVGIAAAPKPAAALPPAPAAAPVEDDAPSADLDLLAELKRMRGQLARALEAA